MFICFVIYTRNLNCVDSHSNVRKYDSKKDEISRLRRTPAVKKYLAVQKSIRKAREPLLARQKSAHRKGLRFVIPSYHGSVPYQIRDIVREHKSNYQLPPVENVQDGEAPINATCEVCMDTKKNTAFIPCGHGACNSCADRVGNCPVCRRDIRSKQRLYF